MSSEYSDPRWEEFLSTGEDPCGLEQEKDIVPARKRNMTDKYAGNCGCITVLVLSFCIGFLSYGTISDREDKTMTQEEYEMELSLERVQRALEQMKSEPTNASHAIDIPDSENTVKASHAEVDESTVGNGSNVMPNKTHQKQYTQYQQGYWDGYDEGYDDRIQRMGFGYKYSCDGGSYEYQEGYDKGYRDGFTEGYEDYEAFGDDEI